MDPMANSPTLTPRAQSKARLREFQAQLAKRIREASTAAAVHPRLAIRVGELNILLDLAETGEIVSVPKVTKVPLTLPWYLGLSNVRGSLVGLVDMSIMFGGPATPVESNSRAVLLASKLGVNAAILATRVVGLRNVDEFTVLTPNESQAELGGFVRTHYRDTAAVQWAEISLKMLSRNESFLQVGI